MRGEFDPKTDKITPVGILWFLISVCVMVISGMTASWANTVEKRIDAQETRMNLIEQRYSELIAQENDVRDHIKEMDAKLDQLLGREGRGR